MKKEMLINVLQPEESRIAIVEDGVLEELYVERSSAENYVGNIYKGKSRQHRAEHSGGLCRLRRRSKRLSARQRCRIPVLQASGEGRTGRRPTKNVNRPRWPAAKTPAMNEMLATSHRFNEIFQRGSEVLVQVIKEGIGNKGPTLSTYISIPGRYLVLMPGLQRVGVSRKIDDEKTRRQLAPDNEGHPAPGGTWVSSFARRASTAKKRICNAT